jgi:endonuclease III
MPPPSIRTVLKLLTRRYAPRPWQCWGKAVDVLIDTILSQNTSAANSNAGYRRLRRRFRSWNQLADAPVDEVERCIRISGLSRIKAPRIQQLLRQIKTDRGKIDLQFLAEMEDLAAYQYLTAFQGVGPKTAACTLLFAFGKMVFPVDTHIHRIAIRLGLIDKGASPEAAQETLTSMIPPGDRYAMHLLWIEQGRKVCRASSPRCDDCVLSKICPKLLDATKG